MSSLRGHVDYTVAIVSAIWFETAACRAQLDEIHDRLPSQPGDDNSYVLGRLGQHNIVLVCLPGTVGNTAASRTSTNLLRTFPSIRTVLLVGIGGGVAGADEDAILERDLRLGDVVVAMPSNRAGHGLVEYDLGRETDSGFELKSFLPPSPALLRSIVSTMRMDPELRSRVERHVQDMKDPDEEYERPNSSTDVLFLARASDSSAREPEPVVRPPRKHPNRPKIHYGLIATGDTVVKSAASQARFVKRLAQEGEVLCFEMEGAGVATSFSCLVVRGICDYSDSHKNKRWQLYAAATAAAYAKELLKNLDPVDVKKQAAGSGVSDKNGDTAATGRDRGPESWGTTTIHQGKGYVIQGGSHSFGNINFN